MLQSVSHPRLRVVHVVLQLDTGGMEKLLVEFARHADRTRFDLRFVSLTTRGRVADELESLGWPVEALHTPPGLRPRLVLRLARLFRRWRADVVHVHNTKPLIYAGPAARLAGASRVVYTRHGQRHGATRGQDLLFRLTARSAHYMVCVSEDSARLSVAGGLSASRVCRIWNGIDIEKFAFAGPTPGGPVVMVGRLSPEKNVDALLRAAAIATRQRPELRFEIAGDGPCMPALRALATQLGLESRVQFLGDVRDVASLLKRASIFVLPSLTEGISLTLLEAMARGLPVVATRVGGNPEVVADEETGILVPPADPQALAHAIVGLTDESDRCKQMGIAGRQRVERHFDVRLMVRRYESLYQGAAAETDQRAPREAMAVQTAGGTQSLSA
jgi:sugar transferase (PEP-CTERM/EpsH1 system associated)